MATRNKNSRRRTKVKPQGLLSNPAQNRSPNEQEAVDGILVKIRKTDLTVSGEQAGQTQKLPGYSIDIAIPDWDKNRDLLKHVEKGYRAHQKIIVKLQGQGASRAWLTERFVEIDKTVSAALSTIAKRIQTRRWRDRERGKTLQVLRGVFSDMQRWTEKASRYSQRAEACSDPDEKEMLLDATIFSILKIGELINKVELMQHEFWKDFSAAHFLNIRHMRNLAVHTDDLTEERITSLGKGIIRDLHLAVQHTLFPLQTSSEKGGYMVSTSKLRDLAPSRPGEKPSSKNSIPMINIDEHERFIIRRVGLTEDNKLTISSSVAGKINLRVEEIHNEKQKT